MTPQSQKKIETLCPEMQGLATRFLEDANSSLGSFWTVRDSIEICEALRDESYQVGLYTVGRSFVYATKTWVVDEGKIVTSALPSQAKHCQGKAFDICFQQDNGHIYWPDPSKHSDVWLSLARIGFSLGLTPGAFWHKPDWDHYEI